MGARYFPYKAKTGDPDGSSGGSPAEPAMSKWLYFNGFSEFSSFCNNNFVLNSVLTFEGMV